MGTMGMPAHHPAWPMKCPECDEVRLGAAVTFSKAEAAALGLVHRAASSVPLESPDAGYAARCCVCRACKVISFRHDAPLSSTQRLAFDAVVRAAWNGQMNDYRITWRNKTG